MTTAKPDQAPLLLTSAPLLCCVEMPRACEVQTPRDFLVTMGAADLQLCTLDRILNPRAGAAR